MNNSNLKPRWKPGQSGNPSGKPAIPEHLKAIASLSQHEVTKIVSKYARMTRAEIQLAVENAAIPMLELSIASIFAQAAKTGDFMRLGWLLDRAIGKVPSVEIEVDASTPLASLTDEELLRLVGRGEPKELETA